MPRLAAAGLVILVLSVMAARLVGLARGDSLTYDERAYIYSGVCLVDTGRELDPRQPVGFRLLAGAGALATPGLTAPPCVALSDDRAWFAAQGPRLQDVIWHSRLGDVVLGMLVVLVLAAWGWAACGPPAAAVAAVASGFEPTVIAHTHLATPDALLTLGLITCIAAHWAWQTTGDRRWLAASAAGLALGLLAKVIALEVVLVLFLAAWMPAVAARLRGRRDAAPARALVRAGLAAGVVAAGGWLLLCLAYLPLLPRGSSPFHVVMPPQWWHSLTYQLGQAGAGTTNYLNGYVYHGANLLYFPEAIVLKTTLPLLLLVVLAIVAARTGRPPATAHLLCAAAVILVVPSLGGIDIGVRYVLALYPLMAMAAASLVGGSWETRRSLVVAGALVLLVGESLAHGGDSIGYFNQLAGARPERYLADSNLDWGQDAWRLRDWWVGQGRPELTTSYFGALPLADYGLRTTELPAGAPPGDGRLAVSLTRLVVYGSAGDGLDALRQCPSPGDRVGVSIQLGRGVSRTVCAVR
jgi:hypothetical protein